MNDTAQQIELSHGASAEYTMAIKPDAVIHSS